MTDTNPYLPPRSELTEGATASELPTIEQALSRSYDFGINALLKEAQRLSNSKVILFIPYCLGFLLLGGAGLLLIAWLLSIPGADDNTGGMAQFRAVVSWFWSALLASLFIGGLSALGIRHATGRPAGAAVLYGHLKPRLMVLETGLVIGLMVAALGWLGWVGDLISVFVLAFYLLAIALVIERGMSPWRAMQASKKAISQHWYKAFVVVLALGVCLGFTGAVLATFAKGVLRYPGDTFNIVVSIIFLILFSWLVAILAMVIGVLYRTIFAAATPTPETT